MSPASKPYYLQPKPVLTHRAGNADAYRLVVAVSVMTAVLKAAKVTSLVDLDADPSKVPADLRLTVEQMDAVEANLVPLSYLRVARAGAKGGDEEMAGAAGARTIVVCDTCGRWQVTAGTVQSGCALTTGCTGSILRPSQASRYTAGDRSVTLRTEPSA